MTTNIVQIGNTDNKLTQQEWSNFCTKIHLAIVRATKEIHFFGGASFDQPWQNSCVVFNSDNVEKLKEEVSSIGKLYKQDSIAWTEGTTKFI